MSQDSLVVRGIDYSALRRGFELFEFEDGPPLAWPRCEMTDCPNNICIGMSKSLCYPHGIELGSFTREQFEVNRSERLKAGKRGLTDDNME